MKLSELTTLVAAGESERVEFKRTTGQRTDAMKTVCALLNGLGGFVLFGVSDRGEISGQQVTARTIEEIVHEIRRIEPPAFPEIETVTLESGLSVIALRVSSGGGPYTYDGRAYLRRGPTTQMMPHQRYERLLLERMHAAHRWENQAAQGLTISDLDETEIIRTVEEAIRRQRLEDPQTRNAEDLLTGLGLLREGTLLNAAVVLFAKADRLLPNYPQCLLRLARFRGLTKTEFLDNRQEMGNAFDLLLRAQRFLRDHLPVAGRIVPNVFERIDDPLYPTTALREAIANALCHRDYSIAGGAVSVAIYDDRLEISSTGILPFDLTPEDLLRPHRSRPWNPLIAQTFYRRGIIETWGRGTLKMAELMEQAGLFAPEIEVGVGEVLVRFRPTRRTLALQHEPELTLVQQELLQILARSGAMTLAQIRAALSKPVPERTVQRQLSQLRERGMTVLTGKGRGGRWALKGATE
ncbi:MAG: putative DNA binding domain-containing protein [Acidobacteria bacterium]|nr:putative DNA binding domain-containing protein [Acidobacteriota bacterium]